MHACTHTHIYTHTQAHKCEGGGRLTTPGRNREDPPEKYTGRLDVLTHTHTHTHTYIYMQNMAQMKS
jgi:hypothetical protein